MSKVVALDVRRPGSAAALAARLEELAAELRAGKYVGCLFIGVRPAEQRRALGSSCHVYEDYVVADPEHPDVLPSNERELMLAALSIARAQIERDILATTDEAEECGPGVT